jgi:HAD superfamily phosphoserine phosphatase-like hydrolase
MTACYAGWPEDAIRAWASDLYRRKLSPRIYATTASLLRGIQSRGYRLCVITGSPWFLAEQALELLGLAERPPVLGVGLEVEEGVLLDRVVEPVPWESGKVSVWEAHARARGEEGELVAAFGDTFGDFHLLEAAQRLRVLVHPRPSLRQRAASADGPWCEFAPQQTADGQDVIPPASDRVLEV